MFGNRWLSPLFEGQQLKGAFQGVKGTKGVAKGIAGIVSVRPYRRFVVIPFDSKAERFSLIQTWLLSCARLPSRSGCGAKRADVHAAQPLIRADSVGSFLRRAA